MQEVVKARPDVWFLFMNIEAFAAHPSIRFLPGTVDVTRKVMVINSGDAMLQTRMRGEAVGLVIAECALRNKPLMTYGMSGERKRVDVPGARPVLPRGRAGCGAC